MSKNHTQRALRTTENHSAYGSFLKVSVSGKISVSLTPLKQEGGRGTANFSLFRYPHGDL